MIKYIGIENFKSLKQIKIKPSYLNLCFGMNGMGKSTFLQMMLLLRQSYFKGVLQNQGLLLNDKDLISLGSGKDAFHYNSGKNDFIKFEIRSKENVKHKWKFKLAATSDILPLKKYLNDKDIAFQSISEMPLFNDNFQYLSAEHLAPQKQYQKSEFEVKQHRNIGIRGEYAVHYLSLFGTTEKIKNKNLRHKNAKSDALIHQTSAWLGEISPGTRLVVEDIKGIDTVRLGVQFETNTGYTNEFTPLNVGFGILYVLPVILSLLTSKPNSLLLIENPESHLHPKGQSSIGNLMARAAHNGVQIFCESHSDHIINGIRVAVKSKLLNSDKLSIYYFDRDSLDEEHQTRITDVYVDQKGELSEYPEGLLDEWENLLMNLI